MRRMKSGAFFAECYLASDFRRCAQIPYRQGIAWLIAAALLFLTDAIANGSAGSRELTELGVLGAVVTIAFVAALIG